MSDPFQLLFLFLNSFLLFHLFLPLLILHLLLQKHFLLLYIRLPFLLPFHVHSTEHIDNSPTWTTHLSTPVPQRVLPLPPAFAPPVAPAGRGGGPMVAPPLPPPAATMGRGSGLDLSAFRPPFPMTDFPAAGTGLDTLCLGLTPPPSLAEDTDLGSAPLAGLPPASRAGLVPDGFTSMPAPAHGQPALRSFQMVSGFSAPVTSHSCVSLPWQPSPPPQPTSPFPSARTTLSV